MSDAKLSINLSIAALDAARDYIVASQLAWRHNIALAVEAGDLDEPTALLLTGDVIADTETLVLGGGVGHLISKGSPVWNEMQSILSEQIIAIANKTGGAQK